MKVGWPLLAPHRAQKMGKSAKHKAKTRERAKHKAKANRQHRDALRCKRQVEGAPHPRMRGGLLKRFLRRLTSGGSKGAK